MTKKSARPQIDLKREVVTMDEVIPLFEDLKAFIVSTFERLEMALRRDLGGRIDSVHTRVDDHEVRITTLEGTPQ